MTEIFKEPAKVFDSQKILWEIDTSRQLFGSTISMYFLKTLIFNSPFEKYQVSLISQGNGELGISQWNEQHLSLTICTVAFP